jgi:hypothetical protein
MGASGYKVIYVSRLFLDILATLTTKKYCTPDADRLYCDHAVATASFIGD